MSSPENSRLRDCGLTSAAAFDVSLLLLKTDGCCPMERQNCCSFTPARTNIGQTVFSQLMQLIPTYQFQTCVDRYQGER